MHVYNAAANLLRSQKPTLKTAVVRIAVIRHVYAPA